MAFLIASELRKQKSTVFLEIVILMHELNYDIYNSLHCFSKF